MMLEDFYFRSLNPRASLQRSLTASEISSIGDRNILDPCLSTGIYPFRFIARNVASNAVNRCLLPIIQITVVEKIIVKSMTVQKTIHHKDDIKIVLLLLVGISI